VRGTAGECAAGDLSRSPFARLSTALHLGREREPAAHSPAVPRTHETAR